MIASITPLVAMASGLRPNTQFLDIPKSEYQLTENSTESCIG